jgi:hypothetical protein
MLFGIGQTQHATGLSNLWQHGGFMPNGMGGVIASFAVVMFAFGGIEIIGITAGEAKDPRTCDPQSDQRGTDAHSAVLRADPVCVDGHLPWNRSASQGSPFVQIFSSLGISSAATVLNIVVITAAVSAINSDIFGAGRMMYGLAQQGQAPKRLHTASRHGVPWMTVLVMGIDLAGRCGAQLPDPGKHLPDHCLDCDLRHGVGVADDPGHANRHAPLDDAARGQQTELPGSLVAGRTGTGDDIYAVRHRPARLLRRQPHCPVRRVGVGSLPYPGLLVVGT